MTREHWIMLAVLVLLLLASGVLAAPPCRVLDPELQESYAGGCADGFAHGRGAASGTAEYAGDFLAGRKHGRGVKTWPNGDRYEGEFREDRREGRGVYVFGRGPWAGERYEGQFRADRRHGRGGYRWASGDLYEGPWEDDRVTGTPTAMMRARATFEREALAALGAPGTRVCRESKIGLARREWLRGTVLEAAGVQATIELEATGAKVREPLLAWTACW